MGSGADLIIAYNEDVEPIILEVTGEDCSVRWVDDWACIGSGSWIARAIMVQDERSDGPQYMDLMDCLAAIYFAKLGAQKDPHVGEYTSILVPTQKEQIEFSEKGWDYIREKTPRIAPPKKLEFSRIHFHAEQTLIAAALSF